MISEQIVPAHNVMLRESQQILALSNEDKLKIASDFMTDLKLYYEIMPTSRQEAIDFAVQLLSQMDAGGVSTDINNALGCQVNKSAHAEFGIQQSDRKRKLEIPNNNINAKVMRKSVGNTKYKQKGYGKKKPQAEVELEPEKSTEQVEPEPEKKRTS